MQSQNLNLQDEHKSETKSAQTFIFSLIKPDHWDILKNHGVLIADTKC